MTACLHDCKLFRMRPDKNRITAVPHQMCFEWVMRAAEWYVKRGCASYGPVSKHFHNVVGYASSLAEVHLVKLARRSRAFCGLLYAFDGIAFAATIFFTMLMVIFLDPQSL